MNWCAVDKFLSPNFQTKQAAWLANPERGSEAALRLMLWICRRLSRPMAHALSVPVGLFFWLRTPQQKRYSEQYLARILQRPIGWRDTLRHYWAFAAVIVDRIYFLLGRTRSFQIQLDGEEHLEAVLAQGRGGFLVGAHVGSFESMRATARVKGVGQAPICIAMYEQAAEKTNRLLKAISAEAAAEVVPLGRADSMIRIQEKLSQGLLVGLLADRSFGPGTEVNSVQACQFLGEPALFPSGVFRLAAALKVPVLYMSGLYLGANRYEVSFRPLKDYSQIERAERNEQVRQGVDALARQSKPIAVERRLTGLISTIFGVNNAHIQVLAPSRQYLLAQLWTWCFHHLANAFVFGTSQP
jgi:predicted LPLAT superfamily acyltransferase